MIDEECLVESRWENVVRLAKSLGVAAPANADRRVRRIVIQQVLRAIEAGKKKGAPA